MFEGMSRADVEKRHGAIDGEITAIEEECRGLEKERAAAQATIDAVEEQVSKLRATVAPERAAIRACAANSFQKGNAIAELRAERAAAFEWLSKK